MLMPKSPWYLPLSRMGTTSDIYKHPEHLLARYCACKLAHNDHRQAIDASATNASDCSSAIKPDSIFCKPAEEVSTGKKGSVAYAKSV